MGDWRNLFVGREDDLAILKQAWSKAKGGSPQVVAIVAESGLGKTRLVQEFYSWLSTTEDGIGDEGYWPDSLTRVMHARARREILAINPDIEACRTDGREIPFLWWGIQLPDSGGQSNFVATSLTQYDFRLKQHLLAYLNAIRVRELKRQHAKDAGNTAMDLGLTFAEQILPHVLLAAIPFGSLAFALVSSLKDVVTTGYGAARRQHEIDRLDQPGQTAAESEQQQRQDIADIILDNLEVVCHAPPAPLDRMPLVLVIDDAQWIQSDPSLCKLLGALVAKAGAQQWPLLIIVTCWEAEWRASDPPAWAAASSPSTRALFVADGVDLVEHDLGPADRLEDLVQMAFPGLSPDQVDLILAKAEGNALCLFDVLNHLEANPQFFENRDLQSRLSDRGIERIAATSFEQIVRARIESAPEYVQTALGLASLQGLQFSDDVVEAMAGQIALGEAGKGLEEGEDPHAFIRKRSLELSEFRARYYQQAAGENLERFLDREEAMAALRAVLGQMEPAAIDAGDTVSEAAQVWRVQLSLLSSDDPSQRIVGFNALYQLMMKANNENDLLAAQQMGRLWMEQWFTGAPVSLTIVDLIQVENVLRETGDYEAALKLSQNILFHARSNLAGAIDNGSLESIPVLENEVCMALEREAINLWRLGRRSEIRDQYIESLDMRRRAFDRSRDSWSRGNLAGSLLQMAIWQETILKPDEVLPLYQEALDMLEQHAREVDTADARSRWIEGLHRYGEALIKAERVVAAVPYAERSVALARDLHRAGADRRSRDLLISSLNLLGRLQDFRQQYAASLVAYGEELELVRALQAQWPMPWHEPRICYLLLTRGRIAREAGNPELALAELHEGIGRAAAIAEKSGSFEDLNTHSLFIEQIYQIEKRRDPKAAMPLIEQMLEMKRTIADGRPDFPSFHDLAVTLRIIGLDSLALGRTESADRYLDELPDLVDRLGPMVKTGWEETRYAGCLVDLVIALRRLGRAAEAHLWALEALEVSFRTSLKLGTIDSRRNYSLALEQAAKLAEDRDDLAEAIAYLLACLRIKEEIAAASERVQALEDLAIINNNLGALYWRRSDFRRSLAHLRAALDANTRLAERGGLPEAAVENARRDLAAWQARAMASGGSVTDEIRPWQPPAEWSVDQRKPIAPVSRNQPCPCGSGRRYKACHGAIT